MSLSSIITDIENAFQTTEQDVLNWIAQIKQGVEVAEADLASALKWLAGVAPAVTTDIQSTVSLVQQTGITIPASVVTAANAAVAGLNAIAAAQNAGATSAQTLVNGYVAVKQATVAQAQTALAVAQAAGT